MTDSKTHYLYPGTIFVQPEEYIVTTVLGSCVSVCLWDPVLKIGGINHYNLPLWNGEGLATPKYGNIAIKKLIEKMETLNCKMKNLQAKVFGGGAVISQTEYKRSTASMNIGEKNIIIAKDMLADEKIPIVSAHVGGSSGLKLIFNTCTGIVMLKKLVRKN